MDEASRICIGGANIQFETAYFSSSNAAAGHIPPPDDQI
jgi:hypothetical protein